MYLLNYNEPMTINEKWVDKVVDSHLKQMHELPTGPPSMFLF